jgi:small subunit ribosomal protein S6
LKTQNYEMMFIASPALDEEGLENVLARAQRYFEAAGTQVFSLKSWGMRRLAYIINGQREGRYYLVKFAAPTETINELDRNIRMMEGILRHITVRIDEELVPESVEEVAAKVEEPVAEVEATPEPAPEPAVEEAPAEPSVEDVETDTDA